MAALIETNETMYYSDVERLDPAFKAEWIEALRSGKYEQGFGALQTRSGKFCCLGVVCELLKLPRELTKQSRFPAALPDTEWVYEYNSPKIGSYTARSIWYIPESVDIPGGDRFDGREILFSCRGPESYSMIDYILPTLNDIEKLTFDQIADVINYFL